MSRSGVDDDDRSERPNQALPRVAQPLDVDPKLVAAVTLVALIVLLLVRRRFRTG